LSKYSLFKNGGVPRSTVSNVVNMNKKRVSTDIVYQIASTLGLRLKNFFDDPIFDEVDD